MNSTDHVIYEGETYRVMSKEEAEHGLYVQVKQDGIWGAGVWDGRLIVRDLIDELKHIKKALEVEKIKRFL